MHSLRKSIIAVCLLLLFVCPTVRADDSEEWQRWRSGPRHHYVFMNGHIGAAAIPGVSVGIVGGYPDTCVMISGVSFEFAYAVKAPTVGDIVITDAGGVTAWKLAGLSGITEFLTAGVSVYVIKSQLDSHTDAEAFANSTGGVSNFALKSALTVSTQTLSGTSGEATKSMLDAHTDSGGFADSTGGVSNFALKAALTASVDPGAISGTSLQNKTGVTIYAMDGTTGASGVSNIHFQGSPSGVSWSVGSDGTGGVSVYASIPWRVGYAWRAGADGLRELSGTSSPPYWVEANIGVSCYVLTSNFGGPDSAVRVQVFTGGTTPYQHASGNSMFNTWNNDTWKLANSYGNIVQSGVDYIPMGYYVQFCLSDVGTGVSDVQAVLIGRTLTTGK